MSLFDDTALEDRVQLEAADEVLRRLAGPGPGSAARAVRPTSRWPTWCRARGRAR